MTTATTPSAISTRARGRIVGLFLASLLAWMIGLSLFPSTTFAAETGTATSSAPALHAGIQVDDPVATLGARMENLAKSISKIATPIAILCIVLVLILYLFAPLLPDIAQANKGYIMRALAIVALIGLIPEIVKFVGGLAAG